MPILAESTQRSQHGTWIEVRNSRLRQNLTALQKMAGPRTDLIAVVKANAYGHGLSHLAETLDGKVAYLGVSNIQEALEIKDRGIQTPVFLFGRLLSSELPAVLSDGITLSVSSLDEALEIAELSCSLNRKTKIHVKVDTGMGRLGIPLRAAFQSIEKMASLEGLELEGIYTHFPAAEKSDGFATSQLYDFSSLLQALDQKGITFRYRHASNSSGIVKIKSSLLNLARPGIMLYGIYPDAGLKDQIEIQPVLSLKSRVMMIKKIQAGQSVGYGRTFVADKPAVIATLPLGYSHGYPFRVSGQASVLCKGVRCAVAGRVSMDYLCVDVSAVACKIGDEMTIIGEEGRERISAEDVAEWAGTIPYEILTRLASRLPRFYR